ncbi:MAG: AraC family transcriptional regulator [Saprospiraceae bacterium]|nr:AraC family transcriptional regulator [Saprospiraceae bacterium]
MTNSAHRCIKLQPSGPLSNYIEYFYSLRSRDSLRHSDEEPWFPSGTMDMIFELGDPFLQGDTSEAMSLRPRAFTAGLFEHGIRIQSTGQIRQIGVVFKPGKFRYFIKGNQIDHKGIITPLDKVFGDEADRLWEMLSVIDDDQQSFFLVRNFLEKVIHQNQPVNYYLDYCIDHIKNSNGNVSLDSLVAKTKTSNRHFRRIFKEYVGISPKLYCSMVRLQSLLKMAFHNPGDLNKLAHYLGYYDSSHLSRNFKFEAGMNTVDYLERPALISRSMISS